MYMGMKVSATIILTCMCQDRKMFGSCMCMRVPATILLRCMCHARTMFVSCIRYVYEGSCQYSINMYVLCQDNVRIMYMCMRVPATIVLRCKCQDRKCSGHVYASEGVCQYSIKMYVPSQDSARVMYMCMRVPATIQLRCLCQARTMFWSCICV